jgi:hypothetical protein
VRVHHHAWNIEGVAEDDVGRLASDTRQRDQAVEVGRNLATMAQHQSLGAAQDVARFVAEEAGAADHVLELERFGLGERTRVGIACEERRRHHVDAGIGALRREDRRDEQLQRRLVQQGAVGVRVSRLEPRDDFASPCGAVGCGLFERLGRFAARRGGAERRRDPRHRRAGFDARRRTALRPGFSSRAWPCRAPARFRRVWKLRLALAAMRRVRS